MKFLVRFVSVPIRLKLWSLVTVAVLALLVVGVVSAGQFNALVQPAAESVLMTMVKERAATLNTLANGWSAQLRVLAQNPELLAANAGIVAAASTAAEVSAAVATLDRLFAVALQQNPLIKQVRLVGADGRVRAAAPAAQDEDDSDAPYFRQLRESPLRSDEVYASTLEVSPQPGLELITEVRSAGQLLGYVVFSMDAAGTESAPSLYAVLRRVEYTAGSVYFYLIKGDQQASLESPFVEASTAPVDRSVTARLLTSRVFTRPSRLTSPLTGRTALLNVAPIPTLDRWLVAESQTLQIGGEGEVGTQTLNLFWVLVGAITLLILIGLALDLTLIRPLHTLQYQVRRAAQGIAFDRSQIKQQGGEVGDLAEQVGTLAEQVRATTRFAESRLARALHDIETTRTVGQEIAAIRDPDVLIKRAVGLLLERFSQLSQVLVFEVEANGEMAVLRAASGEQGLALVRQGYRLGAGDSAPVGRVLLEQRPVIASEWQSGLLFSDTRAELALPLRGQTDLIGVLNLHSAQPQAFASDDVQLLQGLADQLAVALVNARLFEESQYRLREIEALNRQLLGESWQSYTHTRRRARMMSAARVAEGETWSDLQQQAIQTGHIVEDARGGVVTVAIPIQLRGVVLGAVECDIPQELYNENVRLLAIELTNRLAITTDSARLFEQSIRAAEREALINAISGKLTQQTDVSQVLQIAIRELGQALRVPNASIRLGRVKQEAAERP